jgi:cytoskeletal protein CcmA (bactofilin family)
MAKTIFDSIKESVMAGNAYGSEPGRRGSSFETSAKTEPRAEATPQPASTQSPAQRLSVFGQSLAFKGNLTAEEDLLIQGRIEGSIDHNATTLTIGVHGAVKGNILANKVIIQGEVQGDVRASDAVIVEASARVHGNLIAPRIGLKDGAKFKGTIDMDVASQGREFHGRKVNELLESAGS